MEDVETELVASARKAEAFYMDKLATVRQVLATFGAAPNGAGGAARKATPKAKSPRSSSNRQDKFGSYGQSVIDAVLPLLPGEDQRPVATRELLEKLEFRQIEVRGENKVNALSALLARSSKVKGHGRAGWTAFGSPAEPEVNEDHDESGDQKEDAQKENEPVSVTASGSDAAGWGVPPPPPASENSNPGWAS